LSVKEPFKLLSKVKNAGSVFLGYNTPEAVGDYYAGANHTLPTSGTARFSSPLSVEDFVKTTQYVYYTQPALKQASADIQAFAMSEGLQAHARSVWVRLEK
jgi:histidinol dehydrogenase